MKKFRLLLVMSSLLALVCSFTACNTDIADDYPAVEISLTAGQADGNSLTFTITATGADDIYYWVEAVDPEKAEPELSIEDASYLDAQVDVNFEQEVTASKLKYTTEYKIYAYAKNFAHNAYAAEITMTTGEAAVVVPAPEVEVVADEEEVYEDSFLVFVTTKNATKAAWLVVPKYTEGVDAAKVFADGTLIEDQLNAGEIAVVVEDLTPDTEYDFYAAVENSEGVQVLSSVVAVTTAKKEIPVVDMQFTELLQSMDLATAANLPGMFFMLNNPETGDVASVFMYDLSQGEAYAGYMANGVYPALAGSFDSGSLPEASCVLADPGYTNFSNAAGDYYPVGDMGADEDGNPYGITLMTTMPDADNNLLEFNFYAVNAATNEPVIIRGQYIGPLGYVASIATWPFNITDWGFKAFEATTEGNVVTLTSNSINGKFELVLTTENGNIEDNFTVGETLAGGFTSYVEGAPELFELQSGRIAIAKAEGDNNYTLIISTRGDETIMVGESGAYKVEALEYPITITFPAAEALSVDGKRWQLPAAVAANIAGSETAVVVADLGVSTAGQLIVAVDYESIYGAEAAGVWAPQMQVAYTVEATDATSGKIVLSQTNMYDEVTKTEIPYSNLTADSVTIDFTNMGIGGEAACTLYTGEVNLQGGGVAM